MNPTRLLYDSIAALKDIQSQMANTADGESTIFEFKEIVSAIGSDDKKIKSLIAKEICAFLNSNDGILCIGIKNDGGVLKISNAYSSSLEDLVDKSISSLFEPSPSGILTKTIKSGAHSFVVVYVPFSNVAPHRVAANKNLESDVQKNYYTRMMSNSVPMPEHLVKAMYLSNGRLPSLEAYPVITKLSPGYIEIQHFIKPDKYKFIKKDEYYTEMNAVLFDGNFNIMRMEDGNFINIENSFGSALHPSSEDYLLNTHTLYRIQDENLPEEDASNTFFPMPRIQLPTYELPDMDNDQTKLNENGFNAIYAVYIQTSIACEGMPLKTNHTLFYLTDAWHQRLEALGDKVGFHNLGNFKGVQVFIPSDVDQTKMPLNGIDECINNIDLSFE
ncbi:MAG TPA: ATP-binding protein [Patescibacteria group bacterium]|nr:ATP-binding protein [Patescibacteria group bacterium]